MLDIHVACFCDIDLSSCGRVYVVEYNVLSLVPLLVAVDTYSERKVQDDEVDADDGHEDTGTRLVGLVHQETAEHWTDDKGAVNDYLD